MPTTKLPSCVHVALTKISQTFCWYGAVDEHILVPWPFVFAAFLTSPEHSCACVCGVVRLVQALGKIVPVSTLSDYNAGLDPTEESLNGEFALVYEEESAVMV